MKGLVFLDVDTQVDFMLPEGKLYVSGAERRIPHIASLIEAARSRGVPVIATLDTHTPDDPEFEVFLPHCVDGTPSHRKIPPTSIEGARRIGREPVDVEPRPALVVEKSVHSFFDNVNADRILEALGARHAVVFGVATDYCVRAAALGLRERGLEVEVVEDAIAAVDPQKGREAVAEMRRAGCRFVTTREVLQRMERQPR